VRYLAKFGVLLLVLLMAAGQLMACMLPSSVLTVEEQACCREMANQCGHQGMAQSHSCCKTLTPPDQSAVTKSSFDLSYQAHFLFLPEAGIQVPKLPQHAAPGFALPDHSPPQAPPIFADILRI
jgi:hypothetical protein